MSCHLINMMVRTVLLAKDETKELIDTILKIPRENRNRNDTCVEFVKNLKFIWTHGTQIERLATLGWDDRESLEIFCSILDNLDELKREYQKELENHGGKEPPELKDSDIKIYEYETNKLVTRTSNSPRI